jgi:hypothetical protein
LQDFTWWSGLPSNDARQALEFVKTDFTPDTINGRTYWFTPSFTIPQSSLSSVFLLPNYDEFTLSYTDRSASIPPDLENHMRKISDRGVFRPIIVVNGQVVGIWKRTIKNDQLLMTLIYFIQPDKYTIERIEETAMDFGIFEGKMIKIS